MGKELPINARYDCKLIQKNLRSGVCYAKMKRHGVKDVGGGERKSRLTVLGDGGYDHHAVLQHLRAAVARTAAAAAAVVEDEIELRQDVDLQRHPLALHCGEGTGADRSGSGRLAAVT